MKFPGFRETRTRTAIIATVLVIVLAGAGLAFKMANRDPKVATYKVARSEFVIDIGQSGELDATHFASITRSSQRYDQGRILSMVSDGAIVKEGDFIMQYDTSTAQKEIDDSQNALDQAQADYKSTMAGIESNMKQLENAYQNQQYTFESNKLTYELAKFEADIRKREMELTFKKSELALELAKMRIDSQNVIDKATVGRADLRVKQAERRLVNARQWLSDLTVRSPKSGLVVYREIVSASGRQKIKVGDSPYPGQELMTIPDLSEMKVKTTINEVDVSRVRRGQPVLISLDALPGPIFTGKVSSIATLARRVGDSEVKVFDVEVIVDGEHSELKPGMTAQCSIVTGKIPNVLSVPLESVFDKGDTTVVYVKKHGWERRPVRIGSKNSDFVIIENGVEPGEMVALRDPTVRLENLGTQPAAAKEHAPGAKPAAPAGGGTSTVQSISSNGGVVIISK
jgi:HlyD family secretion protein